MEGFEGPLVVNQVSGEVVEELGMGGQFAL